MPSDLISGKSVLLTLPSQSSLSDNLDNYSFNQIFDSLSCAHRARLRSVSSPHAAAWLTVTSSVSLGLHFENDELHTAIKWWLGITPPGMLDSKPPSSLLCPEKILDPLCYHSTTCK